MKLADASLLRKELGALIRPPSRVPVSDAAAQDLRVMSSSGVTTPYDPKLTPYMIEPTNTLSSRLFTELVFVGSARSSKTLSLLDAGINYIARCNPGDTGLYFPTRNLAADYSKRRLKRALQNSPEAKKLLPSHAHDDNIHIKTLRHGMMISIAWPSSSELAQRDLKYVFLSDFDAMSQEVGPEKSSPFALGRTRIVTYLSSGMCVAESSPRFEISDPQWSQPKEHPHMAPPVVNGILILYNEGDRRRWYWPCPDCQEYFEPKFEHLQIRSEDPDEAARLVVMGCPNCGSEIEQTHRRDLNLNGVWLKEGEKIDSMGRRHGKGRQSSMASFWLPGVAAAFQGWGSMVRKWVNAEIEYQRSGKEEALRTTSNVDQGVPWLSRLKKSKRKPEYLENRAQGDTWMKGSVPEGVRFIVATVDVQGNRFVVQAFGFGVGLEWWMIDRFNIEISETTGDSGEPAQVDPAVRAADWNLITSKVIEKRYPLDDDSGRTMPVRAVGVDSGGKRGVTSRAYDYWRSLKSAGMAHRLHLLKGDARAKDSHPRVRETWPDSGKKGRNSYARGDIPVLLLNPLLLKDSIDLDTRTSDPGPGYGHIPEWMPREVFEEMSVETKNREGRWENHARASNEAWDLTYYAKGVALWQGIEKWGEKWEYAPPWAKPWDENPEILAPGQSAGEITASDFKVI